ncbi:MAG: helix-turn-helix domain-containing protein [Opitutaceae bacterium]|nr:helix-turn-helix domain-containing protein [Opitutaceae bacterium]
MTPTVGHPRQKREIATSFLKGLDVLTLLARSPEGLTVPEICQRLKFPRTSVLRMLGTLEQFGLVAHQRNVWGTTERFHDWCNRDMYREIKGRHNRALHAIASEVDELVELGIREGRGVRYIDWVQADHPITIDPLKSALYPLHCTATGKLLLSQRPDLCAGLSDPRLLAEIEEARRTGIAWNRRESDPNIVAVATWVGRPSDVTPVICVKWPFFRFAEAKARRALAAIRRQLGSS